MNAQDRTLQGVSRVLRTVPKRFCGSQGIAPNVIPSEAEATIDIRVLPDEDVTRFYKEMARVIDDPAVRIVPIASSRPVAPPSRLDNAMYRALEQAVRRVHPESTVLPAMVTWYTDMALLRSKGVQSYGIGPALTSEDNTNFGAHSDVERILEASLYKFVQVTWYAVTDVAVRK